MTSTKQRRFNIEYLNEILLRDEAILIGEYPKLNRDTFIDFKCKCGKENRKNFRIMTDYCGAFCKECTEKIRRSKTEETLLENYGNKHVFKIDSVIEKVKQTCLKNYNVENPSQSEIIKERKSETCMKNYGVSNPLKSKIIMNKLKQTNLKIRGVDCATKCPQVKEKMKQTNLKIRGVEYIFQCPKAKEKAQQTNLKKTGFKNPIQCPKIKEKIKQTNLKNRGVDHPSKCPKVMEKIKKTIFKIYGVENVSQSPLIQKKIQESTFIFKEYICPNGEIRKIQGFENYALDELFKTFTEEQIITDREKIPTIDYIYENTKHVYFPDIFIPHLNKIIEVKSTWTYNLDIEKLKQKEKYTKEKGYFYEYWIFNSKGSLTIKTEHE